MFQDSLMPINHSYNGVASLKEAVQNRWADKSGSYFLISSNDAEDQGFDQHGIEWVKVSDFLTGDIIELFIAYEVKEHTHVGAVCSLVLLIPDEEEK